LRGNGRREAYSSKMSPGKKLDEKNERWMNKRE
jgi:hypothetical protein